MQLGEIQFTDSSGELVTRIENIEKTESMAERNKGLLGRKTFQSSGLWITPCNSVHTIGMKFAIDLVYLSKHQQVVKTVSNVKAWRTSIAITAKSIIEFPLGTIDTHHLKKGLQIAWTKYE